MLTSQPHTKESRERLVRIGGWRPLASVTDVSQSTTWHDAASPTHRASLPHTPRAPALPVVALSSLVTSDAATAHVACREAGERNHSECGGEQRSIASASATHGQGLHAPRAVRVAVTAPQPAPGMSVPRSDGELVGEIALLLLGLAAFAIVGAVVWRR